MISIMSNQDQPQNFLVKYKKWLIALGSLYLIPRILMISAIIGASIYLYVNNDTNFHPFKSYILSGFKAGHADGSEIQFGCGGWERNARATMVDD